MWQKLTKVQNKYIPLTKTIIYKKCTSDHSTGRPFGKNHYSKNVNLCLFTGEEICYTRVSENVQQTHLPIGPFASEMYAETCNNRWLILKTHGRQM